MRHVPREVYDDCLRAERFDVGDLRFVADHPPNLVVALARQLRNVLSNLAVRLGSEYVLLVLSTGKNVAPDPIEDSFASNPLVERCLILGDGQKFVSALLVPSADLIREWADREGIDLPEDRRKLYRDEGVHNRL